MANTTTLPQLFTELNKYGQNQDFEKALKIANKILQQAPDDVKAFQCKVVCLIQLGWFEQALPALKKNQKLSSGLTFEKAYCEYRLNRTDEALRTLRGIAEPTLKEKELLAQVLYRLEDYGECFTVYRDLVKNSEDDFEDERETNLSAVMAALQTGRGTEMAETGLREDTYELCYNAACFLLGKQRYEEAIAKLRKAEVLCRQTFEDDPDATEEEVDAELGVIRVQLGYALQMQGKNGDATQLYNQVVKQKPSDAGLAAVASNNIVTLNKDQNVFDSKKKMRVATVNSLKQKLTSSQRKTIAMNQCLLYMYTNQGEHCRKAVKSLQEDYPGDNTPALIQAAYYCREKKLGNAVDTLKKTVDSNQEDSNYTKLTLAQLYLTQGSIGQACDVLRSLGSLTYKPGVVSALVTLYMNQEDRDSASTILEEAVQWHKTNNPRSPDLTVLQQANANFHLRSGNPQVAAQMLEEVRRSKPDDLKTLAQLISAYSKFDPHKAQEISRELPSPTEMAQDVDTDALEAAVSSLGPRYIKKATKAEQSPKPAAAGDGLIEKKKKKKKKKVKLPKEFDPKVDPDPERWIPRKERSTYRGRKRDKRREIGKGSQGASSSAVTDSLDASKPASASGSEVGSPRPGTTQGTGPSAAMSSGPAPRQSKPPGAKNKKKKGKAKW